MTARPCTVTPDDELEFQRALAEYKIRSGRQFPTWSEILEVLVGLGYARRIWKPVGPPVRAEINAAVPLGAFRPMGEDTATGALCWFSTVETPTVT